jgi:hypothetical protein
MNNLLSEEEHQKVFALQWSGKMNFRQLGTSISRATDSGRANQLEYHGNKISSI